MPGVAMRAGRRGYGKTRKADVRQLLGGMHTQDAPTEHALNEQRRRLLRSHAAIDKAEAGLAKRERQEAAWSRALADAPRSLRARWAAWRTSRTEAVWHLAERYEARLRRFVVEAQDYARQRNAYRLADVLKRRRLEIQQRLLLERDHSEVLTGSAVWRHSHRRCPGHGRRHATVRKRFS